MFLKNKIHIIISLAINKPVPIPAKNICFLLI